MNEKENSLYAKLYELEKERNELKEELTKYKESHLQAINYSKELLELVEYGLITSLSCSNDNDTIRELTEENQRLSRQLMTKNEELYEKENLLNKLSNTLLETSEFVKTKDNEIEKLLVSQKQSEMKLKRVMSICHTLQMTQIRLSQSLSNVSESQGLIDRIRIASITSNTNSNNNDDLANNDKESSVIEELREEMRRLDKVRAATNAKAHRLAAEKNEILMKYMRQQQSMKSMLSPFKLQRARTSSFIDNTSSFINDGLSKLYTTSNSSNQLYANATFVSSNTNNTTKNNSTTTS